MKQQDPAYFICRIKPWYLKTAQSGYTGISYLQPLPDIDALYQTTEITNSPRVDYPIYVTTPGTYTVWLRGYPTNAAGDSVYVGLSQSSSLPPFQRDG